MSCLADRSRTHLASAIRAWASVYCSPTAQDPPPVPAGHPGDARHGTGKTIAELEARIEAMMQPFRVGRDLLITIPGIASLSAAAVIS